MGIHDRDYYREEPKGFTLGTGGRRMVTNLVLINVAIFLVDIFADGRISTFFANSVGALTQPWLWWRFLTAGFVHSPKDIQHVGFNMFFLWMLGREVEEKYGRKEFLLLYLVSIVVSSVVWALSEKWMGTPDFVKGLGASGAVYCVVILFALNFPKRTVLFMFVFPIPAWLMGAGFIVMDIFGMISPPAEGSKIGHAAHLAGAAFALLYFKLGWRLEALTPKRIWRFQGQPKLKIHDPDSKDRELNEQVDQILEKIHRDGEASLTKKERRVMEQASRRYQKKHR